MNEIAPIEIAEKAVRLYDRMQTAIAECHSLDDIKQIAERAAAIAAYYKQIKDDESVRKFLEIKMRAWRRIGDLLTQVDNSDCDGNQAAHIRKIRAEHQAFEEVQALSDNDIRQAIRVASLPEDFFERQISDGVRSIDRMMSAYAMREQEEWWRSPEGQAEKARRAAADAARAKQDSAARLKAEQERIEAEEQLAALKSAAVEAMGEVGYTLDRHDRKDMKQIVFLIKKEIHESLRQAAFDKRMTMQAVLRAGLAMWFVAHGYDVPDDLKPKRP